MSVAGLILAAGESRRMGFPKALLELNGETFLDRLIATFLTVCDPVIVVLGPRAAGIRAGIRLRDRVRFAVNEQFPLGQFSSLQCGLRAVPPDAEGVVFTLVDHPLVSSATIASLITNRAARFAIPRYHGQRGHPVYLASHSLAEFLSLPPHSQAREVIGGRRDEVRYVDVEDAGVVQDIDTPEAYQRLLREAGP